MRKITLLLVHLTILSVFGQEKLTHSTQEYFDSGQWVETYNSSYTYDSNNNLIEIEYSNYDWTSKEWVVNGQETYTYDENNNRLSEEYVSIGEGEGNDGYRTVNTYDINGKPILQIEQELDGEVWVNSSKVEIIYSKGVLTNGEVTNWDGSNWVKGEDSGLYTFQYSNGIVSYLMVEENWNGSAWESKGRISYTYDSNGFVNSKEQEEWDGTNWVTSEEREEFENDEFGNRIKSTDLSFENGAWKINNETALIYDKTEAMSAYTHPFVLSELDILLDGNPHINKLLREEDSSNNGRTIHHYSDDVPDVEDTSPRLTHATEEYFDGTNWIESSTTLFIYEGNNVKEEIGQGERSIYTYTANNKRATEIYQSNNENESKILYEYNPSGDLTQQLFQQWDGSSWENSMRYEFVYVSNKPSSVNIYEWNENSWELSDGATLAYSADESSVEYIYNYYGWTGSGWESTDRSELIYNANNKILSEEDQVEQDGNWVEGGYKSEYVYDANGNRIKTKDFSFENDKWVINEENFTYDLNALLSAYKHPFYQSDIDVFLGEDFYVNKLLSAEDADGTYRTIYHYSDDVASVNNVIKAIVAVYPNPTSDMLTIDTGDTEIEKIDVFNLLGKKVKTTSKTSFSIADFANGVYVVKITTKSGTTDVTRVVKN